MKKNNKFYLKFFGLLMLSVAVSLIVLLGLFLILYLTKMIRVSIDGPALYIIGAVLISLIAAACVALGVSAKTFSEIDSITDTLHKIGQGDFKARISANVGKDYKYIADSVNLMAEELESIESMRTDFINSFSHELKTPIVSIRGFAKLLRRPNVPDNEKQEYLDIIYSECNRLAGLAGNTLLLSKLESQKVVSEKKEYNLSEQLRKSVLMFQPEWEKKNLDIHINIPEIKIFANAELIQQIWINLLGNAVKFSKDYGDIFLSAEVSAKGVDVKIRDTGIGMSDETCKHIFEKYYQGDSSHSTVGNGLGLAIVKRVVELIGGSITVESAYGVGTCFTVGLPSSAISAHANRS